MPQIQRKNNQGVEIGVAPKEMPVSITYFCLSCKTTEKENKGITQIASNKHGTSIIFTGDRQIFLNTSQPCPYCNSIETTVIIEPKEHP